MTNLVSEQTFRVVVQDLGTPASQVVSALATSQQMIEEKLGRALTLGSYTERLRPASDATIRPSVTPLDPSTPGFISTAMFSVWDQGTSVAWDRYGYVHVSYTAGWTTATLPMSIVRAICLLAQANLDPAEPLTGKPVFTRLGDLAVNIKDASQESSPVWPKGVWALIRQYRRQDAAFS